MYQEDTRVPEAQPRDGEQKQAQEEVQEMCAQDNKKNLRATIQEKDQAILCLTEKLNLEIKRRAKSESNENILCSEMNDLEVELDGLAIHLQDQMKLRSESESNAVVLQSKIDDQEDELKNLRNKLDEQVKWGHIDNTAWKLRYWALIKNNKKEKLSVLNLEATIQEKDQAILCLTEKLNLEIKLRSESESQAAVLREGMDDLGDQVETLTKSLDAQINLGRDRSESWQLRFSALKEESNNREKTSELRLQALLTQCQDIEKKVSKLVRDSEKARMVEISTLNLKYALKEKAILTAANTEHEALSQKLKEQSCEMHSLQLKCQFLGEQNNHEEENRRLRREIVNLEDICLRQKKKNLGFFGRRLEEREAELERMKLKVPAREPVDPPAPVQCPSPVQCLSPVNSPPPVKCPSPLDPPAPVKCPSPVDPPPSVKCPSPLDSPPPVKCPSPLDPPPPVKCPSPLDPPPPVKCPSPLDPPLPVKCPSPIDPPPPVKCPSPVDPLPPVNLSNPPTSSSTRRIAKRFSVLFGCRT